ncbi:hypothetical protein GCM10011571_05380 [Marinithermofilum abyssi]|uniref:DUF86 domain-containing protein n=1 Tax=Marinithermofilum abyssi TaxID=1571185 RepID=A0A8J2YBS7_9BACL|nr:HepT-like ribonuclease domain-containing protein [Marinithermofilum abyssi]GGE07080.1 hypothetical protein GCM10011571_05380 [Marinithermofilum abyssi]
MQSGRPFAKSVAGEGIIGGQSIDWGRTVDEEIDDWERFFFTLQGEATFMIYDVNTVRIESQLHHLEKCCHVIQQAAEELRGAGEAAVAAFALERGIHIGVECVIEVGSLMIDGFMMREAGGYIDIVDILEDEQVLPSEGAATMRELVRFRERLVRRYETVTSDDLLQQMDAVPVLNAFIRWTREYLVQELGPDYPKESRKSG